LPVLREQEAASADFQGMQRNEKSGYRQVLAQSRGKGRTSLQFQQTGKTNEEKLEVAAHRARGM
jgi:hypothetical protein